MSTGATGSPCVSPQGRAPHNKLNQNKDEIKEKKTTITRSVSLSSRTKSHLVPHSSLSFLADDDRRSLRRFSRTHANENTRSKDIYTRRWVCLS